MIAATIAQTDGYDFAHAVLGLYDYFWSELCDWCLEIVKPRLYEGDRDAASMLLWVLEQTLALIHPVMPFATEEIYSTCGISSAATPRRCWSCIHTPSPIPPW